MINIENKPVNLSFINTAEIIVKNIGFCDLSYLFKDRSYPYELAYDEKLNVGDIVMADCDKDIYYFMREIMRIPSQGEGSTHYLLDPANLAEINIANSSRVSVWKTKPRQTMSSLSTYCLMIYERIFRNRKFVLICRSNDDAELQSKRINKLIELLPKYMTNRIPSYDYFDCYIINSDETAWNFATYCIENGINIVVNDGEFIEHLHPMIVRYSMRDKDYDFRSFLSINSTINNTKSVDKKLINLIDSMNIHPFAPFTNDYKYDKGMVRIIYHYPDLGLTKEWLDKMKIMLNKDFDTIQSELLLTRKTINE